MIPRLSAYRFSVGALDATEQAKTSVDAARQRIADHIDTLFEQTGDLEQAEAVFRATASDDDKATYDQWLAETIRPLRDTTDPALTTFTQRMADIIRRATPLDTMPAVTVLSRAARRTYNTFRRANRRAARRARLTVAQFLASVQRRPWPELELRTARQLQTIPAPIRSLRDHPPTPVSVTSITVTTLTAPHGPDISTYATASLVRVGALAA